jgi:hypothetical protein
MNEQNKRYQIRPHHGMCMAYFQGKGYSGEFVENMSRMKEILEQNPEIRLVVQTDDICSCCPNNREEGCTSNQKVIRYDSQVLACCGITEGTTMNWNSFRALVKKEILDMGKRREICGDCQWNDICV